MQTTHMLQCPQRIKKHLGMDADKQTKCKPEKIEYMIIGYPRRTNKVEISQPLQLHDSEIKRVTKTKSLGVMADEELNWDNQFERYSHLYQRAPYT